MGRVSGLRVNLSVLRGGKSLRIFRRARLVVLLGLSPGGVRWRGCCVGSVRVRVGVGVVGLVCGVGVVGTWCKVGRSVVRCRGPVAAGMAVFRAVQRVTMRGLGAGLRRRGGARAVSSSRVVPSSRGVAPRTSVLGVVAGVTFCGAYAGPGGAAANGVVAFGRRASTTARAACVGVARLSVLRIKRLTAAGHRRVAFGSGGVGSVKAVCHFGGTLGASVVIGVLS